MFKTMETVSITLMDFTNEGEKLNYGDLLKEVAENFGGYTLTASEGGWVSENGSLMIDKSKRLDISFHELTLIQVASIMDVITFLFEVADQEAVFVAFNGRPCIVTSDQLDDLFEHLFDSYNGGL